MRTVEVTLAGKTYTITELPSRKNAAWRKKLEKPFRELAKMLESAPETDISNLADIAGLVRSLSSMLVDSVDVIVELLFDYSPELRADRKRIEEEAYDSEILAAFTAVLSLAFPFGSLASKLQGLAMLGSASGATMQN